MNPVDSFTTCFFEIFFGNVIETIQNFGIIPFDAKSLTLDTILFLAISEKLLFGGISVLWTSVSILVANFVFPDKKISTSSATNFFKFCF